MCYYVESTINQNKMPVAKIEFSKNNISDWGDEHYKKFNTE